LARNTNHGGGFEPDDSGGLLGGLLAEEDGLDRRALWRIGSWGVAATGAVVLAVMANQSSLGLKRDQVAAADLTRQAQQIQSVARETQNEARRLAAAIDTLNHDRDRLYSRVTGLEHGLESVTGAIARQGSAQALPATEPQTAQVPPAPAVAPVGTTHAVSDKPTTSPVEPGPTVSSVARDAVKTDAVKTDIARWDAAKGEGAKTELAKIDGARIETPKTETAKPDSGKTDTAKADAAKPEAAKSETAKSETAKPETAKPSPATALMAAQATMARPDPATAKLLEPGKPSSSIVVSPIPEVVAAAPTNDDDESDAPKVALQRTEFGVDVGTANSVNGLRALWRGLLKSRSNAPLQTLRPIIVVKEGTNGLGMQLRLVAGPLNDAGAAARICAVLTENKRHCETTIFDGQRLSLGPEDQPAAAAKPAPHRRAVTKRAAAVVVEEPKKPEKPPETPPTGLTSFFNRRNPQ
jgi:hypothetical protein